MEYKAILFDTRSIQRYIYSGNRLKTNIGASYIVENVFEQVLVKEVLEGNDGASGMFHGCVDYESWKRPESMDWANISSGHCTVAYIGGGNALVLFAVDTSEAVLRKVVEKFSMGLLVKYPGLKIGAAFGPLVTAPYEAFQESMNSLYKKLKKIQATVFPEVNVPYTGLTLGCEVNGEAANFCDTNSLVADKDSNEPRFYSQDVRAKVAAFDEANKALRKRFMEVFNGTSTADILERYEFPLELELLGQKKDETRGNYIAVVHADGNNMGLKFRSYADTLEKRRLLAMDVRRKTEVSFAILLEEILRDCDAGVYDKALDLENKINGRKVLPIRPLILGGDDVTFICPGKLALQFTKRFIEIMLDEVPSKYGVINSEPARSIDSCAGIAILPTSYPFFRGYELAEQLCDSAKARMRSLGENAKGSAWLDFAILHGEQAPTLEQIREQEYTGVRGAMHFGPYRVGNQDAKHAVERRFNIENLLDCTEQFIAARKGSINKGDKIKCNMPSNKIKELRTVLQGSRNEIDRFLIQLGRMGQRLPFVADWAHFTDNENALWDTSVNKTPYIDAIEMMDFVVEEKK